MKPKLNCITLPVADPGRSRRFYEAIFGTPAMEASDDMVLFQANDQAYLVLSAIKDFETYSGITGMRLSQAGTSECILSTFLDSKEEVDELMKTAEAAGAVLSGPNKTYDWGYGGYFRDPDGHQWECLYNKNLAEEKK
jgi:predicted lactoylglutathione lyase